MELRPSSMKTVKSSSPLSLNLGRFVKSKRQNSENAKDACICSDSISYGIKMGLYPQLLISVRWGNLVEFPHLRYCSPQANVMDLRMHSLEMQG